MKPRWDYHGFFGGRKASMERRRLGWIGHESSVLNYGGAALSRVSQDVADRSIQQALDAGINHFDTAADYGDSELRLGHWMPRIRDRIFLATKTGDRTAAGAHDSIRRSLERLQVSDVDLLQLHAIGDLADLDRATGPGGALDGALRAKDEGLLDALGITGQGMGAPATHLEALRRYPFDTVLTPFNFALSRRPEYLRDFDALCEEIVSQDAALMVIRSVARNLWRDGEQRYTTWYEPLDDQPRVDAAVAFALARPEVAGIATAGDIRSLPTFIDAERRRPSLDLDQAADELGAVPDFEPPFLRLAGRVVPDWLAPLVPE